MLQVFDSIGGLGYYRGKQRLILRDPTTIMADFRRQQRGPLNWHIAVYNCAEIFYTIILSDVRFLKSSEMPEKKQIRSSWALNWRESPLDHALWLIHFGPHSRCPTLAPLFIGLSLHFIVFYCTTLYFCQLTVTKVKIIRCCMYECMNCHLYSSMKCHIKTELL